MQGFLGFVVDVGAAGDVGGDAEGVLQPSGARRGRMVTVNLPRGYVFYTVFVAFALMLARSVQNFVKDMINKKSVREKANETGVQGV